MDNAVESLQQATPQKLARLFSIDNESTGEWQQGELGAILEHQLASPVAPELCETADRTSEICTYSDLLQHPHPPVELLRLLKEFAKSHCGHPLSALPTEVMTVLYYASIVAARLHAGARITHLSEAELRRGIEWVVGQPWVEETTRGLLTEAMAELPPPSRSTCPE